MERCGRTTTAITIDASALAVSFVVLEESGLLCRRVLKLHESAKGCIVLLPATDRDSRCYQTYTLLLLNRGETARLRSFDSTGERRRRREDRRRELHSSFFFCSLHAPLSLDSRRYALLSCFVIRVHTLLALIRPFSSTYVPHFDSQTNQAFRDSIAMPRLSKHWERYLGGKKFRSKHSRIRSTVKMSLVRTCKNRESINPQD